MKAFLGVVLLASGSGSISGLWVGRGVPTLVGGSIGFKISLHKCNWHHSATQKTGVSGDGIVAGRRAIDCPMLTPIVGLKLPSLSSAENVLASLDLFQIILVTGFGNGGQQHTPPSPL